MRDATDIRSVGVVGAGAIGSSWAALALVRGLHVVAHDPAPGAEARLRTTVGSRLDELAATGADRDQRSADLTWGDRLTFTADLPALAAVCDVALECGPERLDVKRSVFAELDAHCGPDVLLTSSSSGITPSSFQDACHLHPERVLVAHPFNPPHLMPLVEVVGGGRTSPEAVAAAMAFFAHLGKRPVHIRRELPGHLANRLQAALWREAYHLVAEGVASVEDIDVVISSGPGLRWALLGPIATQHLSGGDGGLAHILDHLGPPMVEWWADLGSPELTPELRARLVAGVEDELADRSGDDLTAQRDAALLDVLATKARHGLAG
jgi:3-hydroxyacyl-CoA dehydrogenase